MLKQLKNVDFLMSKEFVGLGQNVFVEEQPQKEKVGMFYMPDDMDVDFTYGKVVTCSEGYYDHGTFVPATVKVGDVVCFPKVSGTKVTLNDKTLIRVYMSDIVAKQVEE